MMDEILTIMLVEDDDDTCIQIAEYANTFEDIQIIKITNNGSDAYNYAIENMPDAVILDLELNEGGGNGLDFLTKLSNTFGIDKPFILLTTHNISKLIQEEARALGADFILTKYSEGYTPKEPINFLRLIRLSLIKQRMKNITAASPTDTYLEKQIKQNIEKELASLNFRTKSKGYKYLCDIILHTIMNNFDYSLNSVADKYNKSVPSVERAMQRAIKRAWDFSSIEDLLEYYQGDIDKTTGYPTLKKFVLYFAHKLVNNRY